jgi:multiple sugar transport system substrate-binding protein
VSRRAALSLLPAATLAACAGGGRAPGTLKMWAMSYEGDYSPWLMTSFTQATGIPVEVQSLPWTAAHEKLLTAQAGDELPDVLMLPNGWVAEFAMIGAIAPVTRPALIDGIFPEVVHTVRYAGRPYAVPWSVAPQVQFYRSDLLAQTGYDAPPADWAAWRRMGQALKRRRPDDYAVLLYLNWPDALFTFAGQVAPPPLKDRDTRGDFRTPAFRAALSFYKSLFDDGLAPKALSTELQDPVAAFANGYFAIYPYGPTLLLDLRRRAAEIPAPRWAVARMPGPHGPAPVSATSASLCVSARSRQPEAAWALVRHLTSTPSELRFQELIGNLPARVAAWNTPAMQRPTLGAFAAQMRDVAPNPKLVEWERIRLEVQIIAERVVRGIQTIDEGLVAMNTRVDALLAKRRVLVEAGRIA